MNLELARLARRRGIPVVAYICPQVWAWAPWRIRRVARSADLLLVILPFEEGLYGAVHPRVRYVGNPVFDHLDALERAGGTPPLALPAGARALALLPGSRKQELQGILPAQLRIAAALRDADPGLVPLVSCQRPALRPMIDRAIAEGPVAAGVVDGSAHALQRAAALALVCSGTATLEQAWFGTPMVVMYAASEVGRGLYAEYSVAPSFALVNLFAGRPVVPEVLFTPGEEEEVLRRALPLVAGAARERMREELRRLRAERFLPGAAARAAEEISRFVAERPAAPRRSGERGAASP
jgi:lipid-A-disaccharide synthase